MATRISRDIGGKPKSTLRVLDGIPLILYTVETLRALGVNEIIVVSGHRHDVLEKVLLGSGVTIKYNPFFGISNSIGSAWFGNDLYDCDEDTLIINGDSFYEKSLVQTMIDSKDSPLLLVDRAAKDDADVKVAIHDGIATSYGKSLDEPVDAESTDLIKLNAEHAALFGEKLRDMLASGQHDEYWEAVVFNLENIPVFTVDVVGVFWGEIDDIEDYERIVEYSRTR